MADHDRSICERVITVAEEGGLSASTAGELYSVVKSTAKSMATEVPEGWASWKVQWNWLMAHIQPSSGCCFSS
jgi:hypothetical protein